MIVQLGRLVVIVGVSFASGYFALAASAGRSDEWIADGEFQALLEDFERRADNATYSIEMKGEMTFSGNEFDGSYREVTYQQGDLRRTDQYSSLSSDPSITIERDGRTYDCDSRARQCINTAILDELFANCEPPACMTSSIELGVMEQSPEAPDRLRLRAKDIAGEQATCYTAQFADEVFEMCFTPDGIPLYVDATFEGGRIESRVISISRNVDESVFELPYPVLDLGR